MVLTREYYANVCIWSTLYIDSTNKYITWCNISICANKWRPIGWVLIKKLSCAKVWNMSLILWIQQKNFTWYVPMNNWWWAIMVQARQSVSNTIDDIIPLIPIQLFSSIIIGQYCGQATPFKVLVNKKWVLWTWTKAMKFNNILMP